MGLKVGIPGVGTKPLVPKLGRKLPPTPSLLLASEEVPRDEASAAECGSDEGEGRSPRCTEERNGAVIVRAYAAEVVAALGSRRNSGHEDDVADGDAAGDTNGVGSGNGFNENASGSDEDENEPPPTSLTRTIGFAERLEAMVEHEGRPKTVCVRADATAATERGRVCKERDERRGTSRDPQQEEGRGKIPPAWRRNYRMPRSFALSLFRSFSFSLCSSHRALFRSIQPSSHAST